MDRRVCHVAARSVRRCRRPGRVAPTGTQCTRPVRAIVPVEGFEPSLTHPPVSACLCQSGYTGGSDLRRRDPGQRQLGDLDVGLLEADRRRRDLRRGRPPAGVDLRRAPRSSSASTSCSWASRRSTLPCAASTREPAADVLPVRPAARPSWPSRPPVDLRPPSSPPRIEPADDSRSSRWRAFCCSSATSAASRRRRSATAAWPPWPRTCRAAWRPPRRPCRWRPQAAGGEVVGRLAGAAVQLQRRVGRDLHAPGCA